MLHTYRHPENILHLLQERAEDPERVFLVPSYQDKSLLLDTFSSVEKHIAPSANRTNGPDAGESVSRLFLGGFTGVRRIWIWDDLYRAILETRPPGRGRVQIDPPDHWLLLRHVLSDLRERLGEHLPAGVASSAFLDLASQSIRELLREDIPREQLAASLMCQGCPPDGECPRLDDETGLLCRLYNDYTSLLEAENLADSAQIPSLGKDLLLSSREAKERAGKLRICAVGFLSFASGQLHFLQELTKAGAKLELFVPRCGRGDFYTAADQFPEAAILSAGGEKGVSSLSIAAGDRRLSTDTLARELFLWASGEGYISRETGISFPGWENIAVCGNDEELASVLESFTRYGLPYSLKEGVFVSDTVLWASALRARDLALEGWPARETADFLSGVLFSPFDFPRKDFAFFLPSGRRNWSAFLENHPGSSASSSFQRALAFTDVIFRGGRPEELLAALRTLGPEREEMKALLLSAENHPSLDGELRTLNLALLEAEEKERSLRDPGRNLGIAGKTLLRGDDAMAFLSRWAETGATWTPPSLSPAMALYPGRPPVLASAAVWILLGATAKQWPGQVRESPLLKDERKKSLHDSLGLGRNHLPLVPEKRNQREALFRRLAACGRDLCIFVRPLADSGGHLLAPTPFLESAEEGEPSWLVPAAAPLMRFLGEILPENHLPLADEVEISLNCKPIAGISRKDPRTLSLPVPEGPFPLSRLDDFSVCPFFCYCRIRGLEPPSEKLFRRDRAGTAFHILWQQVWREHLSTGGHLKKLVERFFDTAYGTAYPQLISDPRLTRHRKDHLAKNLHLADFQEKMENDGLKAARKEQLWEFPLDGLIIDGTAFKGRCDRLEILAGGSLLIFDYKSGKSDGYRKALQLAAYSLALREEKSLLSLCGDKAGNGASAIAYLGLGDGNAAGASTPSAPLWISFKGHLLSDLEKKARETLKKVAEAFSTGIFQPDYDSKYCGGCSFSSLCRRRDFRLESTEESEEKENND